MRHREFHNEHLEEDGYITNRNNSNGTTEILNRAKFPKSSNYHSIVDEPHPNFTKRIKRGELIIGTLYVSKRKFSTSGGSMQAFANDGKGSGWTFTGPSATLYASKHYSSGAIDSPGFPGFNVDSHREAAMLKCVANLDPNPVDMMEDLLSMKQNLAMLRSPIEAFHSTVRDMRKKRPDLAAAGLWNYGRFALTPFVQSAFTLAAAIKDEHNKGLATIRQRAVGTSKFSDEYNDPSYKLGQITYSEKRTIQANYRAEIFYSLKREQKGLAFRTGTRLKDLPTGLWNIVPYSFMIDRMLDISSITRGLMNLADPNVQIEGAIITEHRKFLVSHRAIAFDVTPWAPWTGTVSGDEVIYVTEDISRNHWIPSIAAMPIPPINYGGLVKNATRITDLVSLSLSAFGRKRR